MSHGLRLLFAVAMCVAGIFDASNCAAQQTCESLSTLKLTNTTITLATTMAPGTVPDGVPAAVSSLKLGFCQVIGEIKPRADSDLKFELWLPTAGWNGKFQQVGNGGFAGSIPRLALIQPLFSGYAAIATDDGHAGAVTDAKWSSGHPEKVLDFGYRAVHDVSAVAKEIIHAFYGKAPVHSYFAGCSDGGREALMEAQRYPEDFDGIVAGAPANFWTSLMITGVWNEQALHKDPASYVPAAKLQAIQNGALAACDALDGLKDGIVDDPRQCHFDPAAIQCKGDDSINCLTAPQVEAVRKIYSGPKNPRTKQQIAPGISAGGEASAGTWAPWIVGNDGDSPAIMALFINAFFGDMVYGGSSWDYRNFNFDADVTNVEAKVGAMLNAKNPDLSRFRARGGKLIQYHGWDDPAISPLGSVDYYESVVAAMEGASSRNRAAGLMAVQKFYRLFMVPGMAHCFGGNGPNSFGNSLTGKTDPENNIVSALDRWVSDGVPPERIIATKYQDDDSGKSVVRTRPLCPYPQVARWNGTGSAEDAANFVCERPDTEQRDRK